MPSTESQALAIEFAESVSAHEGTKPHFDHDAGNFIGPDVDEALIMRVSPKENDRSDGVTFREIIEHDGATRFERV